MRRVMMLAAILLLGTIPSIAQPSLGWAYLGCSYSDTAYPLDLDDYSFGATIDLLPEGDYPYDATMTPDGTQVWIPGAAGDGVVVIDRWTGEVIQRFAVGEYPVSVAFSSDGSLALIPCRESSDIWRIDTSDYSVIGVTPVNSDYMGPGNIALDPASGSFYAVDWYNVLLFELSPDGSSVTRTLPCGDSLWQLVVAHDGSIIYVTDRGTDSVLAIDRESFVVVDSYTVGGDPWAIDISADDGKLVVGCEDSHEAWFIDTDSGNTRSLLLDPNADPRDVDILDEADLAFMTGGQITGASPVYLLDLSSETIVQTLPAPGINSNVIAVQPQMHGDGSDAPETWANSMNLRTWPNPFNPKTEISFTLDVVASVELAIYDLQGRSVRLLISDILAAGDHRFIWDGRDDSGALLGSGLYFARIATIHNVECRKLVMLK